MGVFPEHPRTPVDGRLEARGCACARVYVCVCFSRETSLTSKICIDTVSKIQLVTIQSNSRHNASKNLTRVSIQYHMSNSNLLTLHCMRNGSHFENRTCVSILSCQRKRLSSEFWTPEYCCQIVKETRLVSLLLFAVL